MVNPSLYESLSLILLEALSLGKPMLVNGQCAVLKEHCYLSRGAIAYYMNSTQFVNKLHKIETSLDLRNYMAEKGKLYVETNYNWSLIMKRLKQAIELVSKLNS